MVLDLVQAALGLISPEMWAISVHAEPDRILLYVAVHEHTAQVAEDVDDLVFELEALQDRAIAIEAAVHVGDPGAAWPGDLGRRVYLAKPT
ncbi:hypothetical protein BJY16_007238 [Actinoplanes octamycinicus]|uniref:Uncharacterized protein n=1 Tax=Actinoplanes octamycinicus TaxID=135948 RepID=A0A7W7MB51_9ACTN|nr:hypothetical protein [Actinoplanes octamycinicus]MBB4743779.1 hypothetical protein [Actinoplanes octamycinicus]